MGDQKEKSSWGFEEEEFEMLARLQRDLQDVRSEVVNNLKSMGVESKQIKQYIKDPRSFTSEEWELLRQLRSEVAHFRTDLLDALAFYDHPTQKNKKAFINRKKLFKKRMKHSQTGELSRNSIRKKKSMPGIKKRWLQM